MAAKEYLEPKTDGTLAISVKSNGVALTDATVTANAVYFPNGAQVPSTTNISCAHVGNGVYELAISKDWSTAGDGSAITGHFVAEIKTVRAGKTRTRRFTYLVAWRD